MSASSTMTSNTPPTSTTTTTINSGGSENNNSSIESSNNNNINNNGRGNKGSKRDQNLAILSAGDKDFKGSCNDFEVVIGLATEIPHLKFGKIFSEFSNDLLIYVQSNYERGADLRPLIYKLEDPMPSVESHEPPYPGKKDADGKEIPPSKGEEKKWDIKMKRHVEREELVEANIEKLFALVLGQCTQGLVAEIKAENEYENKAKMNDALWLLMKIKVISAGVDSRVNRIFTYHEKLVDLVLLKQEPLEPIDDYRARFVAIMKTSEMTGGLDVFYPYILLYLGQSN